MESPKEQRATVVMGTLLVRLSQHPGIRALIADLDEMLPDRLADDLLAEFEKVVERRRLDHLVEKSMRAVSIPPAPAAPVPPAAPLPPPPVSSAIPSAHEVPPAPPARTTDSPVPPPPKRVDPPVAIPRVPVRESSPPLHEPVAPPRATPPPAPVAPVRESAAPPSISVPPPRETVAPPRSVPVPPPPEAGPPPGAGAPPAVPAEAQEEQEEKETVVPAERIQPQRTPFDLHDADTVYFHGVGPVPHEESPAARPFMLEEKGLEGREFAFALDRGGLRFYLSTLKLLSSNVTTVGVLLLGKQESIRYRGAHASILNDLRMHGTLLPFAFGEVASGRDDLLRKIDTHRDLLQASVDRQEATTRWGLTVHALDGRIAQFLTPDGMTARRERDRGRASFTVPAQSSKLDLKMLEKILAKEKKIAETIHADLAPHADRAEVEMMVSLGSGSSEEWKPILRAWYDLPVGRVGRFNRLVNDAQYRHFLYELMIELEGDAPAFAFPRS